METESTDSQSDKVELKRNSVHDKVKLHVEIVKSDQIVESPYLITPEIEKRRRERRKKSMENME